MIRVFVVCAGLVGLSGCVLPGDIAALRDSQARYADGVRETIAKIEENRITREEALEEIEDAQRDYDREVEDRVEVVARRTDEAMALVRALKEGGTDGLLTALGGSAGITAIGMGVLGAYRNRTRRRELESVKGGE